MDRRTDHTDTMMRPLLILFTAMLVVGCHKNDVDVSTMNTNRFDADYTGDRQLFTIDSLRTVPYWNGGDLIDEKIYVHVLTERFPAPLYYSVWFIGEQPDQDTAVINAGPQTPPNFVHRKFNVQDGTEYCWRVELHVSDIQRADHACAVAHL